jgi:hypothetical protein
METRRSVTWAVSQVAVVATPVMAQNMTGRNTTDKISGVEDEKSLASGYYPGPGECEDD